ncbi:MAG: DUF6051 family protein [Bacteroidia bacterium]|nr:DUF6051 family protein [Bacteroidia bacterium]
MSYLSDYAALRAAWAAQRDMQPIEGMPYRLTQWRCTSNAADLLPGHASYRCAEHDLCFVAEAVSEVSASVSGSNEALAIADARIGENRDFIYHILAPAGVPRFNNAILLLHGLNEQHWEKCLPWALGLARRCSRPVILFPLALHMQRAGAGWCVPRAMRDVSLERMERTPGLTASSFSNAAISTRLHAQPSRLFWAAMQSCMDVTALAGLLRSGRHSLFGEGTTVDFFGYSIGAFLSQLLLMADASPLFRDARAVLFCGGTTLDRMHLVDRAILDGAAWEALLRFYGPDLPGHRMKDARLDHFLSDAHALGRAFRLMSTFEGSRAERETALEALRDRLIAVVLEGDTVITPLDTLAVLDGEHGRPGIVTHVLDFAYPYSHIMPFPVQPKHEALVEAALHAFLDTAAGQFCRDGA